MHIKTKRLALAAVVAAASLILAGCSSAGGSSSTGKTPIVVASVNALSGAATFPEASAATKAVFDDFNAKGGLNGRKISYKVFDDKGDPAAASTAAHNAIDTGAVAMVGSASLLECAVNHSYYEQNNIVSVQGTGVDPFCFTTPNIAAANDGPFFDALAALTYATKDLKLDHICALVLPPTPADLKEYKAIFAIWSKATGAKFAAEDDTLTYGQGDYTPNVAALKDKGCDAIDDNAIEPDALGIIKAAQSQGLNVPFLQLTSVYSDQFAKAVTYNPAGIYIPAEFSPYTDPSDTTATAWRALMKKYNVPETSFAQGGYLAAEDFLSVLKTIKGPITRDTVTAAFKNQKTATTSPMRGNSWIFGPGKTHQPNHSAWEVEIKPGADSFTSIGPWVSAKQLGFPLN